MVEVSVIVPVRGTITCVEHCVEALRAQTLDSSRYEVLIVWNCESAPSPVREWLASGIVFLSEPQRGSYAARNYGMRHAQGQILAFTDADCVPEPQWLERGLEAFNAQDNCGLIAGCVELTYSKPDSPNLVEKFDSFFYGFPQQRFVTKEQFAATVNMFTSQAVVADVGEFRTDMMSWGDKEWGQRVAAAGYQLHYAPGARVRHPARVGLVALVKKVRRDIGGYYDFFGDRRKVGFLIDIRSDFRFTNRMVKRYYEAHPADSNRYAMYLLIYFLHLVRCLQRALLYLGFEPRNV